MGAVLCRLTPYNRNSIASLLGYASPRLHGWTFALAETFDEARRAFPAGPDVALYSFTTWEIARVAAEVRAARRCWPQTRLIAGGPHASGDPHAVLGMGFQAVFTGEGERTFLAYLQTPDQEGIIPAGDPVELDEASSFLPEYGLTPPLELSRGCPQACQYCQTPRLFPGPRRHRSLTSIGEECRKRVRFGITRLHCLSPNAFGYGRMGGGPPVQSAIVGLLETIAAAGIRDLYFGSFPSEVRPEDCLPDLLRMVRRYCRNRRLVIGAQSGSDRMLRHMRRGHTAEDAWRAVVAVQEAGFQPVVDLMFGLPDETVDDRHTSLRWMRRLQRQTRAILRGHTFMPLPGTPWAGCPPSELGGEITRFMDAMAEERRAEGDWRRQAVFGERTRTRERDHDDGP